MNRILDLQGLVAELPINNPVADSNVSVCCSACSSLSNFCTGKTTNADNEVFSF